MSIAYDTTPIIEVQELKHDYISINFHHVSEQDHANDLDWIKVTWSTGDSITTSERTASIGSSGIAGTKVTVEVIYVYNDLETVPATLEIDVPEVPLDPELSVDTNSENYLNIPQTNLFIDAKRLIYADEKGKLTKVILPSDPYIEEIKKLIPESKWKYLNERLVTNPYDSNTLVDLLSGLVVNQELNVVSKVDDVEEKIKLLKEAWLHKLDNPDKLPDLPKPEEKEDENALKTYVLGRQFYAGNLVKMTMFEKEVTKYIQGKQLDINILMDFYKEFPSWSTVEKYYKLPILVVMLKDYIASVRTEI